MATERFGLLAVTTMVVAYALERALPRIRSGLCRRLRRCGGVRRLDPLLAIRRGRGGVVCHRAAPLAPAAFAPPAGRLRSVSRCPGMLRPLPEPTASRDEHGAAIRWKDSARNECRDVACYGRSLNRSAARRVRGAPGFRNPEARTSGYLVSSTFCSSRSNTAPSRRS